MRFRTSLLFRFSDEFLIRVNSDRISDGCFLWLESKKGVSSGCLVASELTSRYFTAWTHFRLSREPDSLSGISIMVSSIPLIRLIKSDCVYQNQELVFSILDELQLRC